MSTEPSQSANAASTVDAEKHLFRIDGALPNLIEQLDELATIYVQARSRGGGLGKFVELRPPIIDVEFNEAIEPDAGICLSLSELVMAHAARSGNQDGGFPSLDLEFNCHSAGVSFVEMPGSSAPGTIERLARQFPGTAVNQQELEDWRNENCPAPTVCQCCRDLAYQRTQHPQSHPLFGIFQHAHLTGTPLNIRLHSDHIEMASTMTVQNLLTNDGYLIITDAAVHQPASAAMHLDLAMVHSFSIIKKRIDDVPQTSLKIYDMHGNHNFTISSEVEAAEKDWRTIASSMDEFYRSHDIGS